jgi:hypothetical protein
MNIFFNYLFQSEEELKKHGKKREISTKKSKQRKENRAPVEINTNFSDEISTDYLFCKR